MVEAVSATSIGQVATQGNGTFQAEPVSHNIVDLFEHLLGQPLQQPPGPTQDTIARMLANPSSLGEHILANVEGMHQTFSDFSSELEARLVPPGAEGMSLSTSADAERGAGGVYSALGASGPAESGPAMRVPESVRMDSDSAMDTEKASGIWQSQMQELLWVQYNVGRIMVHEEMMSKAAGKSTQNLDMLLRGQ